MRPEGDFEGKDRPNHHPTALPAKDCVRELCRVWGSSIHSPLIKPPRPRPFWETGLHQSLRWTGFPLSSQHQTGLGVEKMNLQSLCPGLF